MLFGLEANEYGVPTLVEMTNDNGEFVLEQAAGAAVAPGKYFVRVTTFQPPIEVTDPPTPATNPPSDSVRD